VSLAGLLVRPVTILQATTTTDRNGATSRSWTSPTLTDTTGWLAQNTATEDLNHRDGEISTWVLYLPADTTIAATDRVVLDGQTFEVTGPPNPAWTPRGVHHLEVTVKLMVG
jgi:head-tail adaptor